MPVKFHYEDNLYFIHSMVRTIDTGLRLDVDPEYFRDKILEDILFIDATLLRVYSSLKENTLLINRTGHLRSLRRTMGAFTDFLKRLLDGEVELGDIVDTYRSKLTATLHTQERIRSELDAALERDPADDETSDTISSQEYGFLLADGDDGNDDDE